MLDFDEVFSSFVSGGEGSAIRDIYDILPVLPQSKIKIINSLNYYRSKWNLVPLGEYVDSYLRMAQKNKDLNFLSSMNMKNLLKAYTQDELVRGIKVNSQINNGTEGV